MLRLIVERPQLPFDNYLYTTTRLKQNIMLHHILVALTFKWVLEMWLYIQKTNTLLQARELLYITGLFSINPKKALFHYICALQQKYGVIRLNKILTFYCSQSYFNKSTIFNACYKRKLNQVNKIFIYGIAAA